MKKKKEKNKKIPEDELDKLGLKELEGIKIAEQKWQEHIKRELIKDEKLIDIFALFSTILPIVIFPLFAILRIFRII